MFGCVPDGEVSIHLACFPVQRTVRLYLLKVLALPTA